MERSKPTKIQITNELKEFLARIKLMRKSLKICSNRIYFLLEKEVYLETIFIAAQLVEHDLKLLIEGYASRRRILHLLGEKDMFADVKLTYSDDEPLGALIGKLKDLRIDPDLLKKIGFFNGLRKEAIHHIFDGRNEVELFEKRVSDYLRSNDFKSMLNGIADDQEKVSHQIGELVEVA